MSTQAIPEKLNSWARVGQMFFSTMSHRLYDTGLYKFVTGSIWRCPTALLLDNYADNISNNHLEVGVGSGYFLRRTLCADYLDRLMLSDLNRRCLAKSSSKLAAFAPITLRHNIQRAFPDNVRGFSSVGMNYVLHCIPGRFSANQAIFQNVHAALDKGGVFFGSTLIPGRLGDGIASWLFMRVLNGLGIFNNSNHRVAELKGALEVYFSKVEISMVGNAAVFVAQK